MSRTNDQKEIATLRKAYAKCDDSTSPEARAIRRRLRTLGVSLRKENAKENGEGKDKKTKTKKSKAEKETKKRAPKKIASKKSRKRRSRDDDDEEEEDED